MAVVNKGFRGRHTESARQLPPGQHLTADFPVLQAGPTPRIDIDDWRFTIRMRSAPNTRGHEPSCRGWPGQRFTVDIHCVTTWSKLDTKWRSSGIRGIGDRS
jgi:DMSO/TMAO reductase YedYZ molybdopterin-dependent catalytic subunit